ncbi:unnamed protein product [Urochloa decumbens]|uniref:Gnk2-homologous domain-containing protein n=1 Tax=Urochloa decumbens TaxID=240449 RepID=A0ABC8YDL5_9POAL
MLLPFLFFLVAVASLGVAVQEHTAEGSGHHHPPLLDCAPPPAPAQPTHNDSSFRANLASALAGLPSMVAASSEGLAVLESVDAGPDHAFARGGCFGVPGAGGPSRASACIACLKAAARDLAVGGCRGSRRAGAWRDGCFMAYADTGALSDREDAFRGWFYPGGSNTTTLVLADSGECMVDDGADCFRCINDLLPAPAPLGWLWRLRGGEVVVVSYTCFLSIKISPKSQILTMAKFWSCYMLVAGALVIGMLFCFIILTLIRGFP